MFHLPLFINISTNLLPHLEFISCLWSLFKSAFKLRERRDFLGLFFTPLAWVCWWLHIICELVSCGAETSQCSWLRWVLRTYTLCVLWWRTHLETFRYCLAVFVSFFLIHIFQTITIQISKLAYERLFTMRVSVLCRWCSWVRRGCPTYFIVLFSLWVTKFCVGCRREVVSMTF